MRKTNGMTKKSRWRALARGWFVGAILLGLACLWVRFGWLEAQLARLSGKSRLAEAIRYALTRWQRNARVQARSQRNGRIFHATGPVRWGRDMAMRLLGPRLLDLPWLYRGDGASAL